MFPSFPPPPPPHTKPKKKVLSFFFLVPNKYSCLRDPRCVVVVPLTLVSLLSPHPPHNLNWFKVSFVTNNVSLHSIGTCTSIHFTPPIFSPSDKSDPFRVLCVCLCDRKRRNNNNNKIGTSPPAHPMVVLKGKVQVSSRPIPLFFTDTLSIYLM